MPAEPKPRKVRLDELVVERGLCESRAKAKALIIAGQIRSGTEVLDKPGKTHPADIALTLLKPPPYVSRGGEKLDGFLEKFPLSVEGARCLDIGASTGGFTDNLLQRGAEHVTCVDVGTGQLHAKLRNDPRVANFEKTNARRLDELGLPHETYDIVVIDVSFISLRLILPGAWNRLKPGGTLIALVKPQFEAEKAEVDRGKGVIRDDAVRLRILGAIQDFARRELPGLAETGVVESPVAGPDGNREFLYGITRT